MLRRDAELMPHRCGALVSFIHKLCLSNDLSRISQKLLTVRRQDDTLVRPLKYTYPKLLFELLYGSRQARLRYEKLLRSPAHSPLGRYLYNVS